MSELSDVINCPKVVIVILNWNKPDDTIECLKSVYNIDYDNYEVLLIDNASTDDSVYKINQNYPYLKIIENNENNGFTGGNNQGIRIALERGADYVWLLNNDTVVKQDTLKLIVEVASSSDQIGLVSPAIYYYDNDQVCQFSGAIVDPVNYNLSYLDNTPKNTLISNSLVLWGTALLIRCDLIKKVGLLRSDYFAYGEDEEFSLRSLKANYTNAMVRNSIVLHKNQLPGDGSLKPYYYYYYKIRNSYYRWTDSLLKVDKVALLRTTIRSSVSNANKLKHSGRYDLSSACLRAIVHIFLGIRGRLDEDKQIPKKMIDLILWHPYLLIDIFTLDFKSIIKRFVKTGPSENGD
jgi:GT2 family glycosyltransferase